jgi:hypothetical protein
MQRRDPRSPNAWGTPPLLEFARSNAALGAGYLLAPAPAPRDPRAALSGLTSEPASANAAGKLDAIPKRLRRLALAGQRRDTQDARTHSKMRMNKAAPDASPKARAARKEAAGFAS